MAIKLKDSRYKRPEGGGRQYKGEYEDGYELGDGDKEEKPTIDESLVFAATKAAIIRAADQQAIALAEKKRQLRIQKRIKDLAQTDGEAFNMRMFGSKEARLKKHIYQQAHCERLYTILSDPEALYDEYGSALLMGIDEETHDKWKKDHEEYAHAVRAAQIIKEEIFANRLASGMPYAQGLIFVMKNKFGWTDKVEETHRLSLQDVIRSREEIRASSPADWDRIIDVDSAVLILPAPTVDIDDATKPKETESTL